MGSDVGFTVFSDNLGDPPVGFLIYLPFGRTHGSERIGPVWETKNENC